MVGEKNESNNVENMGMEKEEKSVITPDQYSLYEYIKKHPSMILTIFTTFVAIITFFSNLSVFLRDRNLLIYWNFDADYVELESVSSLYTIGGAFICSLLFTIASIWYTATYETYLYRKKIYYCASAATRNVRSVLWRMRAFRIVSYALLMLVKIIRNKEQIKRYQEGIVSYRGEINYAKKALKLCSHASSLIKKSLLIRYIKNVLPVYILWFGSSLCFSLIEAKNNPDFFVGTVVIFVIGVLCLGGLNLFLGAKVIKRKEIKNSIALSIKEGSIVKTIDSIKEEAKKKEYPFEALARKGVKSMFSNITIIMLLIGVIASSFTSVLTNTFFDYSNVKNEKVFRIVNIEEEQYAIIYHGQDKYYLEKALIEDDTITIDTKQQRIIAADDMEYTVQEFQSVIKLEGKEKP